MCGLFAILGTWYSELRYHPEVKARLLNLEQPNMSSVFSSRAWTSFVKTEQAKLKEEAKAAKKGYATAENVELVSRDVGDLQAKVCHLPLLPVHALFLQPACPPVQRMEHIKRCPDGAIFPSWLTS